MTSFYGGVLRMSNQWEVYFDDILDFFHDEKREKVSQHLQSLQFKMEKNHYHVGRLKKIIEQISIDDEEFYNNIHLPIYYEAENLLITLRSTVDIAMHLINSSFSLGLTGMDVSTYHVYQHTQLPNQLKQIFYRFTRKKDNLAWNFISTSRNEIVHETSIPFVLPIHVDFFDISDSVLGDNAFVFFDYESKKRDLLTFMNLCINFLSSFLSELLRSIFLSLKNE